MLNLGQVVYDLTNERVLIFGGIEMIQKQDSGKCYTMTSFLTEELQELLYEEDEETPFEYQNFAAVDSQVPIGEFVAAIGIHGHYFGCIDWPQVLENTEWTAAAKRTIEAAKDWPIPVKHVKKEELPHA